MGSITHHGHKRLSWLTAMDKERNIAVANMQKCLMCMVAREAILVYKEVAKYESYFVLFSVVAVRTSRGS